MPISSLKYFQKCFETGMRVRAGLITQIYRKALVLSSDAGGKASGDIGKIIFVLFDSVHLRKRSESDVSRRDPSAGFMFLRLDRL